MKFKEERRKNKEEEDEEVQEAIKRARVNRTRDGTFIDDDDEVTRIGSSDEDNDDALDRSRETDAAAATSSRGRGRGSRGGGRGSRGGRGRGSRGGSTTSIDSLPRPSTSRSFTKDANQSTRSNISTASVFLCLSHNYEVLSLDVYFSNKLLYPEKQVFNLLNQRAR